MTQRLRQLGRRSIPWGLVGMLGLLVLVESALERHHLDFTRFYIHDWRVNGRAARQFGPGCRTLCFGDSLVKFGLAPEVLERRLGGRAYNLAVCDGQAASSYFLLRRALEAGARPEAVIVDFVPHLLAPDPRHNLRQWPELLDVPEAVDLIVSTRHAGFGAALTLGSLLASVKDRHEIRAWVKAALQGRSASHRSEVAGYVDRWTRDRGALLCADRRSYDGSIDAANRGYFPARWACHLTNERYIGRFLDLARSRGIRVYWLLPPVAPEFQARREELGLEASYSRFARTMADRHRNLCVLDARHAGFDHSVFIDPLHLSRQGAVALSEQVAALVARLGADPAGGPRWAMLSDDRCRPPDRAREELGAPTVALQVTSEGRRP